MMQLFAWGIPGLPVFFNHSRYGIVRPEKNVFSLYPPETSLRAQPPSPMCIEKMFTTINIKL